MTQTTPTNAKGMTMTINATRIGQMWVVYFNDGHLARRVFTAANLDDCRRWADGAGYDGLVIGKPSSPWAE